MRDDFPFRPSRRELAALTLALGLKALPAAAFTDPPQLANQIKSSKLPPVAQRLPDNPLVVKSAEVGAYGGTFRTPILGGTDRGYGWLRRMIGYEHLVRFVPEGGKVIPNLAELIDANADSTQFTFHLRKGMKWSDGQPVTADDYVFWYQDIGLDKDLSPSGPGPALVINGQDATLTKIDDFTIRYAFSSPYGLFLQQIASGLTGVPMVAPKHYATQFHKKYNAAGIDALVKAAGSSSWIDLFAQKVGGTSILTDVGTWANPELPVLNAWQVTTPYNGSAAQVVATRNPYYWKVDSAGNQLPYFDEVIVPIVGDSEVLKLMTMRGELDFVYQPQNFGVADKSVFFDSQKAGKYHFIGLNPDVSAAQVININMVAKDPAKRQILDQRDFRIALSQAINRDEIIDIVYAGQGEPYQMAPRPESPFHDDTMAKEYTEFDPDKANKLLDGLGYIKRDGQNFRLGPDGARLTIPVDVRTDTQQQIDSLQLIKNYWVAIGVELQINTIDSALYTQRVLSNLHVAISNVGAGGLNEILNARQYVPININALYGIPWVYWYLKDPRGEEPPAIVKQQLSLYDQAIATADPDKQAALFRQVLKIASDEFRIIGISLLAGTYAIATDRMGNIPPAMIDSAIYPTPAPWNVATWFARRT